MAADRRANASRATLDAAELFPRHFDRRYKRPAEHEGAHLLTDERTSDCRDTGGRTSTRIAIASNIAVALIIAAATPLQAWPQAAPGPLTALLSRLRLGDADRRDLRDGRTVVKTLDAGHPSHIVVLAVAQVDVSQSQFVARVRDTERLWRGPGVPATGTIGDTPRVTDLANTPLSQGDLASLRTCRLGACDVKLSGPQIAHIRAAIEHSQADWRSAALRAFRAELLEAIEHYRRQGLRGVADVHDHDVPID